MEDRQDEWLGILTDLVRIPSENPPGDTTEIADYLIDLLGNRGISYEVIAPKEEMPNVVAQFEGEAGDPDDGPHLGYNGHLDTFPVTAGDRWDRDPFSGAIDDGKIHGLGVSDMHGGFTASLAAFLYLYENCDAFAGRVTFTATSDEETGSEWGAKYLLDEYPKYRSDSLINGEPTSNGIIRFGGRGAVWLDVTVRGESAHSAYPAGRNALDALYEWVADLRDAIDELVAVPERERELILAGRGEVDATFGEGATDYLLQCQVNLNIVNGGEKVNLTAETAHAELDIRLPLGASGETIVETARELAAESAAEIDVEVTHHTDPTYTETDKHILQYMQECAGLVRGGDEPVFSCGLAMTDGRFFRQHDVPTALYGPTPHNMGHQNEYIYVDEFMEVVQAHAMAGAKFMDEQ